VSSAAIWSAIFSVAAGAVGYLLAIFWFQPVLHYRDVKSRIASDLVFYANAVELEKLDGTLRADTLQRKESNRRCAAELTAIYAQLPFWYRKWLAYRDEDPKHATDELIRLSNTGEREEARECVLHVRTALHLSVAQD